MNTNQLPTSNYERHLVRFLVALPVLSLMLGALAWLRYGIDMPWFDDWRAYADGSVGSFRLSYLFRPVNDTLAPVGFALEAVAQHLLDGNSVAYQFISMVVVLGSLLLLQWKLLHKALDNTIATAACFSLTVLMLQPDSYWGLENLAYHQCLPLVFILSALWITVCSAELKGWRLAAVPMLGLLAGFTYISGAFGAFSAGVALLLVSRFCYQGETQARVNRGAAWLTAASSVAVAAQFYFSVLKFHASGTHAGIPLAFPNELQFWVFYLGKIGRSLLLPPDIQALSLVISIVACVAALAMGIAVYRRAAAPSACDNDRRFAALFISLSAVVWVYLMLVAAGRTNYRASEIDQLLDIFSLAFTRFHFFWVTLLWPWFAAGILFLTDGTPWAARPAVKRGAVALVLLLAALLAAAGAYSHMQTHRELAIRRSEVAQCLLAELQKGGPVRCPGLLPPQFQNLAPDAYPAYLNARKVKASFIRNFPLLPERRRPEDIPFFYDMAQSNPKPGLSEMEFDGESAFKAVTHDPKMFIETRRPEAMRQCVSLDMDVTMKTTVGNDMAQLFFQPANTTEYSEKNSVRLPVEPTDGFQTLTFRLESGMGFRDALRFDPVTQPQTLEIKTVRVYCVRQQP